MSVVVFLMPEAIYPAYRDEPPDALAMRYEDHPGSVEHEYEVLASGGLKVWKISQGEAPVSVASFGPAAWSIAEGDWLSVSASE